MDFQHSNTPLLQYTSLLVKTLLIVDGMAYVYRAFYAIPPMSNSEGLPTNAIYGFVRILERLIAESAPDFIAVVFDTKEPTFRHDMYEDYKAQRAPMPEELVEQLPWIKEYIKALNLPSLEYPGFEADDVIATLARFCDDEDLQVLIATADKDLCQLVNDKIGIMNSSFKDTEILDPVAVEKKFGVLPEQIVDYLTLVGDSADNIPGVKGIGPKTAASLLREYNSLENIYLHLEKLKPAVKKNFELAKDKISDFKKLISVDSKVPVKETLEDLVAMECNLELLNSLREHLNFSSQGRKIRKPANQENTQLELF